jgi:hypothetical protein
VTRVYRKHLLDLREAHKERWATGSIGLEESRLPGVESCEVYQWLSGLAYEEFIGFYEER